MYPRAAYLASFFHVAAAFSAARMLPPIPVLRVRAASHFAAFSAYQHCRAHAPGGEGHVCTLHKHNTEMDRKSLRQEIAFICPDPFGTRQLL